MKLKDLFKLSINSILHRRLRAWLTLLGIIIGVTAVVAIISIGNGASASVSARLSGFGADIITITPGFNRAGGFSGFVRGGIDVPIRSIDGTRRTQTTTEPVLTDKDVQAIKTNLNVLLVNEVVSGRAQITFGSEKTNASIQGVNPLAFTKTNNLVLASGRFLTTSDSRGIVIGNNLANATTFTKPITLGQRIDINGVSFAVVGILSKTGTTFGSSNSDNTIFMPFASAWDVLDVNKNNFSSLQVKVNDSSMINQTITELTNTLLSTRKLTSRGQDFSITSSEAIKQQIESVTQTLTLFLGAIAAISLVVGAIGIANSMFTSVLEKTREIGVMKALGATNNEILILFVIESGLFGFIGGIIGVIIAFILTGTLDFLGVNIGLLGGAGGSVGMIITPELVIIAILLSTIIGVISGVIPAQNAAKMRPVDALKYE